MGNKNHHHHHGHGHGSKGLKGKLGLIGATIVLLMGAMALEHSYDWETWQLLLVYLVPYLLVGHETLKEAVGGICHGDVFNEHFLMSLATVGALCIGFLPGAETEFLEAVFVMLFFQVGELFEGYAEGKSRDSISHLMAIRPDVAYVERQGRAEAVSPQEVRVGDVIVIRPGEKVPLDGVVIEGSTSLNAIALTGESLPREVAVEDGESAPSSTPSVTSPPLPTRKTRTMSPSTGMSSAKAYTGAILAAPSMRHSAAAVPAAARFRRRRRLLRSPRRRPRSIASSSPAGISTPSYLSLPTFINLFLHPDRRASS